MLTGTKLSKVLYNPNKDVKLVGNLYQNVFRVILLCYL